MSEKDVKDNETEALNNAAAENAENADIEAGETDMATSIESVDFAVVYDDGGDSIATESAENAENTEGIATEDSIAALGRLDKMLIDPPREGAIAVVKALGPGAPRRIVYVSCNPATLARDTAVLFHEKGYRLKGAGIANMFPQTSHVESVALLERD